MALKRSWIKRSTKPWKSAADHTRLRRQRKALQVKRPNEADSIMSRRVREAANWICARCHGDFSERRYLLTNSHFIGRTNSAVRYDDDNCDALFLGGPEKAILPIFLNKFAVFCAIMQGIKRATKVLVTPVVALRQTTYTEAVHVYI